MKPSAASFGRLVYPIILVILLPFMSYSSDKNLLEGSAFSPFLSKNLNFTDCNIPSAATQCTPPATFTHDVVVNGTQNWADLLPGVDPSFITTTIRITGNGTLIVPNSDVLLKSSNAVLVIDGIEFIVNNGNFKLDNQGSRAIIKNATFRTSGNVQQIPLTFMCITNCTVEIGDELVGGLFNTGGSSTSANFQNDGGYRYLNNVCLNVTHDLQLSSTGNGTIAGGGLDIFIDVCAEIGDQGANHAATGIVDGSDSGNMQNNNVMKIYNSQFNVIENIQNQSASTMLACNTGFRNLNGNFQNSGLLQGTGLCLAISQQINQNSGSWTASVNSWYAADIVTGNPPLGAESTLEVVLDLCFTLCCAGAECEDLLIICQNIEIECNESILPENTGYPLIGNNYESNPNCPEIISLTYEDDTQGACPVIITRTWTVTNTEGETSTCVQIITVADNEAPVFEGTANGCWPAGISSTTFNSADAVINQFDEIYFATDGRIGSNTNSGESELGIHKFSPYTAYANQQFIWPKAVDVPFSIVYNPNAANSADRFIYTVTNGATQRILKYNPASNFNWPLEFDGIWLYGAIKNNSTLLINNLAVNGTPLNQVYGQVNNTNSTKYINEILTGADFQNGFTITGMVKMDWSGTTPTGAELVFKFKLGKLDCEPSLNCAEDFIVNLGEANINQTIQNWLNSVTAEDECGGVTVTNNYNGSTDCGEHVVIFTATDECGNSSTCSALLTISDNEPPVFATIEETISLDCTSSVPAFVPFTATDNSGNVNVVCEESSIFSQEGLEICEVSNMLFGGNPARIAYFEQMPGAGNNYFKVETAQFIKYGDGTAKIFGVMSHTTNDQLAFEFEVHFRNARNWAQWSALGRTYMIENGPANAHLSLTYYEMDPTQSNIFTGIRAYEGSSLNVSHYPANFMKGFQLGNWGNVFTSDFGFGGWMRYGGQIQYNGQTYNRSNVSADFNLNITGCVPIDECVEMITRSCVATDACGNSATQSQTILITDETAPTFTYVPANYTANCEDVLSYENAEATDACSNATVSELPRDTIEGNCINRYEIQRTFRAVDECGNETFAYQTITVVDNTPPTFTYVPADYIASCEETLTYEDATATDNCGIANVVELTRNTEPGNCANRYTVIRVFIATDICGNTSTATQTITVVDNTPPVVTNPPTDLTVNCGDIIPPYVPVFTDNCDGPIDVQTILPGIVGHCGVNAIEQYIATDVCGNQTTVTRTLTFVDEIAPTFTSVPANYAASCEEELNFDPALATDNCGEAFVTENRDTIAGNCANEFNIVRTFTATDVCGNTASTSQTITITDEIAPTFTFVPADNTYSCEENIDFVPATASDNCGTADVTETRDTVPGTCLNEFSIIRTYTATDHCGNTATASSTIYITDEVIPAFVFVPADYTASCEETLTFENATATDNCGTAAVTEYSRDTVPGNCINNFLINRTFRAIDECGNETFAYQTITVVDNTAPTFTFVPANYTASCEETLTYADATATDNCGIANVTESRDTIDGDCINRYVIIRTFTATDLCGNTSTATQSITVIDNTPPVNTNPPTDLIVNCGDIIPPYVPVFTDNCDGPIDVQTILPGVVGHCGVDAIETYIATDLCGNQTTVTRTLTFVDEIEPTFTSVPANYTASCEQTLTYAPAFATDNCGNAIVSESRDTTDGVCENEYIIVRTFTATDVCGNTATASQSITITDEIAPLFTYVPGNSTFSCEESIIFTPATATDNCGSAEVTESRDTIPGICENEFSIIRTFTATDLCGNTATASSTIYITDEVNPTFVFIPANYTASCEETLVFENATATDNCGTANVTESRDTIEGDCVNRYIIVRTFTATDLCGNTASATQTITVIDNTPPVNTNPPTDLIVNCGDIIPPYLPVFTDNCEGPIDVQTILPGVVGQCGVNAIEQYIATDVCGNQTIVTRTLTFVDEIAPTFTSVPSNYTASCEEELTFAAATATDNCGQAFVTESRDTLPGTCANEYSIIRTFTATDECGNTATATQTISITDNIAPIFVNVPGDLVFNCTDAITPFVPFTATDNCGDATVVCEETELQALQGFQQCDVLNMDYSQEPAPRMGWFQNMPGTPDAYFSVEQANFMQFGDGTAHLTGVMTHHSNPDLAWEIDIWFRDARTWAEWSALNRSYKYEQISGDYYLDMLYYEMDDTKDNTLTGIRAYAGSELSVVHMPADYTYGFQYGEGGNAFTTAFGFGGWMKYSGNIIYQGQSHPRFSVAVDFNFELECTNSTPYPCVDIITRTCVATDACGNQTSAQQIITIFDNEAPVFTHVPANYTTDCHVPVVYEAATAQDNCSFADITETRDTIPGNCAYNYDIVRTFTVVDECGNENTATQTIFVRDVQAPVFQNVPANYTANCEDILTYTTPTAIDNCGTAVVIEAPRDTIPGTCINEFTIIRTFIATDDCGNSNTVSQTINVVDVTNPTFTFVPANYSQVCNTELTFASATATDNCGIATVTEARDTINGVCANEFSILRTFTATDICGNTATATQTIFVTDEVAPTFTFVPANYSASCEEVLTYAAATATDNCGIATVTEVRDTTAGQCVNEFTILRTFTATDLCGNTATATQTINVTDELNPTFTFVPANYTAACSSDLTFVAATATDNCGIAVVTEVRDTTPGTCVNEFSILRTFTATDLCGNTATATQTIIVTDEVAPTFTFVPASYSQVCNTTLTFAAAIATDNCGIANVTEVRDTTDGVCANEFSILRTFTATDLCGNTATATQTINVTDEVAPTFTFVPANYSQVCNTELTFAAATATDNCGTAVVTEVRDTIDGQCANEFSILRTFTATDHCGNIATATQIIYVTDDVPPTFTFVPAGYTIACDDQVVYQDATATDNCGTAVVTELRDTVLGNCLYNFDIVRTFTATDLCGNTSTATQIISVRDTLAPLFTFIPGGFTASCHDILILAPATATDNCGIPVVTEVSDTIPGICVNEYTIVRTFTATDLCGNTRTATQTINIIDEVDPTFSYVPANYTASCETTLIFAAALATDNCGIAYVTEVRDTTDGVCANEFSILRTFTATDLCGNTATATQIITVTDEIAPTFTFVPANYSQVCNTELTFAAATATDNCGTAVVTEVRDTTDGVCANEFSILRTFTATDLCGNTSTATQTIFVTDDVPPTFTFVPAGYTIACDDAIVYQDATATDNCGTAVVTELRDTVLGNCLYNFDIIRTFTATDLCGNTATATQIISVRDTLAPLFTFIPGGYTASCHDILILAPATATDNCGIPVVTEVSDTIPGICANEYTIVRTFTATDLCGNARTATQTINIIDEENPTFTFVPANYSAVCSSNLIYTPATATDNCGIAIVTEVRDTTEGDCANEFIILRTFTATDLCGNTATATQTITVTDEVAPTFTFVPANYSQVCNTELTFAAATATDNCGIATVTEVRDTTDGVCANEFSILRTFTATDLCGNTATATQTITVTDEVAPTFTFVPANYSQVCNTELTFAAATATDNCGMATVTEVRDTTDGTCENEFSILRTFTATDLCGNTATATQTITVTDEVAPTFTFVPANYSQVCNTELTFAAATATDNCGNAVVTEVRDTTDGICANEFSILRTFTATDLCGNTATATQTINVTDEVVPTFTFVPASYAAVCSTELTFAAATATDNCGIANVTEVRDTTEGTCANEFSILRTFTATDLCGNTATATQTITVTDEVAPTFTFVPANYTASCELTLIFAAATAADNCGIAGVTEVRDTTDGTCVNEFSILRTFTATDLCGNTATATQTITVTDEVAPTFTFVPANYSQVCNTELTFAAATATDNCGIAIVSEVRDTTDGVCDNEFSILRTFTATDLCGNTATATQTITITDEVAPTFTFVPASYSAVCNTELTFAAATATDNCGIAIVTEVRDTTDGTCENEFSILRTFTATDLCGNTATATQTITVTDEVAPTFTFVPVNYSASCEEELTYAAATATDNCGIAVVTEVRDTTPGQCENEFTIIRTFTATDLCGNTATAIQTINVHDTIAPIFINVPADLVFNCNDVLPEFIPFTATDNCGDPTVVCTETELEELPGDPICDVMNMNYTSDPEFGEPAPRIGWFQNMPGTPDAYFSVEQAQFERFEDGTAHLTGIMTHHSNSELAWEIDVWFRNARTWEEWSALGRSYKYEHIAGNFYQDMLYYEMDATKSNTLTGIRAYAGSSLSLVHMPADFTYGFQYGFGGNAFTTTFGFGGWMKYSGNIIYQGQSHLRFSVASDFNFDLECLNEFPEPCTDIIMRTCVATDACGNETTASQMITIIDTEAPEFTFVPANVTVECDEDVIFQSALAEDNCTAVTITELRDTVPGLCVYNFDIIRTFTATDECGNTSTASHTIFIRDTEAPNFNFIPANYTASCEDELTYEPATATDNCGIPTVVEAPRDTIPGQCLNEYTIIRRFVATDECGNSRTATQTINVVDETLPVFTFVPANYSAVCNTELTFAAATATDNCGTANVTEARDTIPGICENEFTILRTFTATDLCGNTATSTQTINVTDDVPPTFTLVPASYSAVCDDDLTFVMATATDNCGTASVNEARDTVPGTCENEFTILRTFTATDLCGNTATATQTITVTDEEDPTFTFVPASYSAVCNNDLILESALATDNCGIATVTETRDTLPGTCENEFSILRTFTATDLCGNTSTAAQTINVTDNVPPTFTFVPANYSAVCNTELTFTPATATDNCGIANVTEVRDTTEGTCANEFSILRTFTATDLCGNTATATQTIFVTDDVPPAFTFVPSSYEATCTEELTFDAATATDNCGIATVTENRDTIPGICESSFSILRTFTATDLCGNTATATQTIVVGDNNLPTFTYVPQGYTIACDDEVVFENATATDACGEVLVTEVRDTVPGTCINNFDIVRTFTASDDCENTVTAVQIIQVRDTLAPLFSFIPASYTASCSDVLLFAPATSVDNCGTSVVTEVRDTTDGECENEFSILRTFTTTDLCGNTRTATQVINVVDDTNPVFTFVPASYTATCDEELSFASAEATDNCGIAVVTEVRDTTDGNCASEFIILRTFTATDICGNTTTATQTITVSDEIAPDFTFVPANYSADCTETLIFLDATATDNCGTAAVTVTQATLPGSCANEFSIVRTFVATDLCGNTATATQTITVTDDVVPTFTFVPANYTVGCNEEITFDDATATDNCGAAVVTESRDTIAGNCADNFTIVRTFTATDLCGNTATATQTITSGDNTLPTFTFIPQGYTISCDDPVVYQDATATDVCGNVTVSEVRDTLPGTCINNYDIRRTFTAADNCGNNVSVIQIIQVRDTLAPLFNFIPAGYTASCSDQLVFGNATAVDNCGGAVTVIEQSRDTIPGSCANNFQIVRVFRATDVCGNFRLATQTISVVDNTAPSVVNCPDLDLTIICMGQQSNEQQMAAWHTANLATLASCATDNCSAVSVSSAFNPADVTLDGCNSEVTAIYIVSDACGNTTSVSATFTVEDAQAPLIQFNDPQWEVYPTNSIVYTECNTNNQISGLPNFDENSVTPVENCDLNPNISYTQVLEGNGDCAADGYFYRLTCTWTATDDCGNQSSRVLIIQVEDNTAPVISGIPADVVMGCTELLASPAVSECGDDTVLIDLVTVEDACECAEVEFDELIIGQTCDETYQILRTWSAVDNCGNATFESQLITVINNYNLEATFTNELLLGMEDGDEIVIECTNGLLEQPDYVSMFSYSDIVVEDYCNYGSELQYAYSEYVDAVSTNCKVDGFKERKALEWSVVDQCGNYDRMTIYLVLKDVTGPEIEGLDFACSQDLSEVDAFDFCSETMNLVYQDMSIPSLCDANATDIMRVWQATDDCGNVSVFEQRILSEDVQAEPTFEFTNPAAEALSISGGGILQIACQPQANNVSGFSKNDINFVNFCDEPLAVNFEEEVINIGDCETDGYAAQVALTWWAVDACGRRTEFSALVEMIDTIAPEFENVPAELFVECGEEAALPIAIDACVELQVLVSEEQTIWTGDCVYEFDVQRNLTSIDACGNEVEASQIVHYIHTKGPEISGIKLIACEDEAGTAKAISACTGDEYPVIMTQTMATNPCAPGQVITRTYKAEDECGNITEIVQTLYRNDNEAPALQWVNNRFSNAVNGSVITLKCSEFENIDGLFLESNVTATNECAYEVEFTAAQVEGINCQTSGFSQQIDYNWLVSDPCGNSTVFQIRVNYIDDVAPEFLNAPADTTLFCAALPVKVDPTIVDYCGSDVQMTFNEVHHNTGIPGVAKIDRIWTATDACGNASTHTQTINVDQKVNFACDFSNFNIPSCGSLGNVISVNAQGGTAPYTYYWNVVGGACQLQAGQGSNSIEYGMGFTFVRILVLVVDANGCTSQCELEFQCDPSTETGIAGKPNPGITLDQVYPNPAEAELYLDYTSDKAQKGSVRFLDILGQEVRVDRVDLLEGTHTIMSVLSDFKPGVYSVELRSGNQVSTKVFLRY